MESAFRSDIVAATMKAPGANSSDTIDHGELRRKVMTVAAALCVQTTGACACTSDGTTSLVSMRSVKVTQEPYVCSYRVKNTRHIAISTISEIIWWRCTGVHCVAMNQKNQPSTTAITTIISARASETSPPSENAPLATAHISHATGSRAANVPR